MGRVGWLVRLTFAAMRLFRALAVVVLLAGLAMVARPYLHGLSFVIRVADLKGTARTLADLDTRAVHERDIVIPLPEGSIRARRLRKRRRQSRGIADVGPARRRH